MKLTRSMKTWQLCNPAKMAEQSTTAIHFAFEDARADILALSRDLEDMKSILRRIAYPQRNTPEESACLNDFVFEIVDRWPLELLQPTEQP